MPNDSRILFQTFVKKSLTDRDALFAVLDHFRDLHCFDRDHYAKVTEAMLAENQEMKERIAKLEGRIVALESR